MSAITFLIAVNALVLVYFAVLNIVSLVLCVTGWNAVNHYVKRRPLRDYAEVARSELSMPISIVAPAYNEEPSIVESVRSLLECRYVEFEVIVVNDGSKDGTFEALRDAFGLVETSRVPRAALGRAGWRSWQVV